MSDKIQGTRLIGLRRFSTLTQKADLKVELEQSMRKNRELAETNRQNMKEYTKLKAQYEKAMSKSTIASSYGKTSVAANVGLQQAQPMYASVPKQVPAAGLAQTGNSRIGVCLGTHAARKYSAD